MKKIVVGAFIAASLMSLPALAGNAYVTGGVGQSKLAVDVDGSSYSKNDQAFNVGAGYQITPKVAVELTYRDYGRVSERYDIMGYEYKASVDTSAVELSLVGSLPITQKIDVHGRLGVGRITIEGTESFDGEKESDSDSANRAIFGLGVDYKFTDRVEGSLEWSRFANWDDLTVSSITAGVKYRF